MASGNYRADHVGGLFSLPGSAGEFADDPVAGVVDAQLKAVMDVFTDGIPVHAANEAVAAAAALEERAPSWAKLKVTLPSGAGAGVANDLFAAGVTYVQFDLSGYSDRLASGGVSATEAHDQIAAEAAALGEVEVPEGATTAVYLGSADPLLASHAVAEDLFALPVDRFLVGLRDAASDAIVDRIPQDRFAVLGLVDASTVDIEDPEPLLARLDAAAETHGDKLAVCPSDGFGESYGVAGMTPLHQQRKLELVSDVARMFWGTEL